MGLDEILGLLEKIATAFPGPPALGWLVTYFVALLLVLVALFVARTLVDKLTSGMARLARYCWRWLVEKHELTERIVRARDAVTGDGLWLLNPIQPPTGYPDRIASSIPVLAIANLKGGVGKTTLAANLAAYFADSDRESPERVLLIDLDYQGSLSLMCAGGEPPVPEPGLHSLATQAIAGTNDAPTIVLSAREVPGCDLVNIIQSFFDLAKEENRLMVHWLIREEQNDIRYNLANLILNELVQRRFNRVIIDCPPRLSTSCVQALCATTHVLIPTVLHPTSTSAVRTFLDQLRSHKDIWPELKRISVVGTMTAGNLGEGGALQNVEHAALESLRRDLHAFGRSGGLHPALLEEATFIQRRTAIADATGTGIAYIRDIGNLDAQLREMFARLGRKIIEREAE